MNTGIRSWSRNTENTLERGRHRPDLHAGSASKLSEYHFHVIEGFADYEKHHYVGDQEGAAAVLIGRVWKSPDVPKTDRECHAGHEELQPIPPLRPLLLLFFHLKRQWNLRNKLRGVSQILTKESQINVALPAELTLFSSPFPSADGTDSLNIPGVPSASVT